MKTLQNLYRDNISETTMFSYTDQHELNLSPDFSNSNFYYEDLGIPATNCSYCYTELNREEKRLAENPDLTTGEYPRVVCDSCAEHDIKLYEEERIRYEVQRAIEEGKVIDIDQYKQAKKEKNIVKQEEQWTIFVSPLCHKDKLDD